MKKNNILISIYYHPEAYPPTLNAINELAKIYDQVMIVYRPHRTEEWIYPDNCILIPSGKLINAEVQQISSIIKKILYFVQFTFDLWFNAFKYKANTVLLYDYFPMFSAFLIRPFLHRNINYWYHNHDVAEENGNRKWSLGWWAIAAEKKMFKHLDLFTFPSTERLNHFNLKIFKGVSLNLPNYPSIKFYRNFRSKYNGNEPIKLLYQGTVSGGHGLEKIAAFITNSNENINFHIAGRISNSFRNNLSRRLIEGRLVFEEYIPYAKLPELTQSCHIGLAINKPKGVIYQTGGTASNKIYEYAACGLPILYFDNEHYNEYLAKFEWAYATDLSSESIERCINEIMNNYTYLSDKAKEDFQQIFNYEKVFEPIKKYLIEKLQ